MLPRALRLPVRTSLPFTRTIKSHLFLVKVRENNLPYSRFGFTVSKKVDPRAVIRNRSRRSLQMAVQKVLPRILPGYDFLFLGNSQLKEIEQDELHNFLDDLLRKNNLLV